MNNRIEKHLKKGVQMGRKLDDTNDLVEMLENSEGYAVGITLLNKGVLEHFLLTKKFPLVDLLKSNGKVKELIVAELEKDKLPEY